MYQYVNAPPLLSPENQAVFMTNNGFSLCATCIPSIANKINGILISHLQIR